MSWQIPGYEQIRVLGDGASGLTVLARHEETGVPVAVKYLSDALVADTASLAAFRAEARLLAGLDDPNIVRLYEYVESDQGAAIAMELVNGPTLGALLREGGSIEPEAALAVLRGSLLGLAAAHAVGVVHRDYKPENVLVDGAGNSKLADFGIAAATGAAGTTSAGTLPYLAPEGWQDAAPTPARDVYAATATFFECLTGRRPFDASDPAALRRQHANAPIPSADVPKPLQGIVRSGLAKDPARRPADAAAFAADLDAVATAAYGADWEEKGRRHLARRAALLSMLWPLGVGGSAVAIARTFLGRSRRAWAIVGAAVAAVLVIGIGVAASRPGSTARAGQNLPLATTSLSPSTPRPSTTSAPPTSSGRSATASRTTRPSATTTPTRSRTATTTVTLTPTASTTRTTLRPPPPSSVVPPPAQTVKVTIVTFGQSVATTSKATVTVATATTAPVVLKLNYYESKTSGEPQVPDGTISRTLSGSRNYTITDLHDFTACTAYWVLQAVTGPTASNGTQTATTSPAVATC